MYIAPQGTIKLLTGVPLEPSFDHTIYFETAAEQARWFEGKTKFSFTNQYYSRKGKGILRVEKCVEELYDCNYLMFKNDGFVLPAYTKWFYCFITNVEYVNNAVSDIYFQLDPMQTWFFDYQLEQCFVEREHSATDNVGDNLVEEKINMGEYTYIDEGKVPHFSNYSIVIASGCKPILDEVPAGPVVDSPPGFYNGLFAGVEYLSFDLTDENVFDDISNTLRYIKQAGRTDEIIAIYMMPTDFIAERSTNANLSPTAYTLAMPTSVRLWTYKKDGITTAVRNKKLYTYPYSCIYLTSSDGESAIYRAEYFNESLSAAFTLQGAMGCPPQIQITPLGYNFSGNAQNENYNESITLTNYPMCSWTTDTFKAWLAQNKAKIMAGMAQIGVGAVMAAVAGGTSTVPIPTSETALSISKSGVQLPAELQPKYPTMDIHPDLSKAFAYGTPGVIQVANSISSGASVYAMPNQVRGVDRGIISLSTRELGFHLYTMRIRDEYAAILDSYFDRYGYATKITKIPNRNVRPHWTYTKTIDCTITGTLPAEEANTICSIYNKGITFWRNGNEVGNYSLDNSPLSNSSNNKSSTVEE